MSFLNLLKIENVLMTFIASKNIGLQHTPTQPEYLVYQSNAFASLK